MGFNNQGVDALLANVQRARFRGVLGINIGKNFDTPIERAADDYLICLRKVYTSASYVTVNISSPNTKNLRQLQQSDELGQLLGALKNERERLADRHGRRVPLALKIAPDLDEAQISAIADLLVTHGIDAVIATNTTLARDAVAQLPNGAEAGGLSGAPLTKQAQAVTAQLAAKLGGAVPVIGVGGIMNGDHAAQRIAAGASLVQLYTGLVYAGPALVASCFNAIRTA
jgi:dihydroorotate dehydrogenase